MRKPSSSQEMLPERLATFLVTLKQLAQSYFMGGHLEQAVQLLQAGMHILAFPEVTQLDHASFLLHYGNMLAARTQFQNAPVEEALIILEQTKQLAITLDEKQLLADAFDSLGFAHYVAASNKRDGDPYLFRGYFQESLERRGMLHDERGVSESLFHLGLTADVLDQKEDAHRFYTQALQLAQQHNYASEASEALRHLGFHEQAKGNFAQAQQYFTESLSLREQMNMYPYLPFAYVALADLSLEQGNLDIAASQAQKALDLSHKTDIKKGLIFSLWSSGHICQKKQEEQKARDYFEQTYAEARAINLKFAMERAFKSLQELKQSHH